jgi:N-acetylneuraminic acid mutarotase
MYVGVLGSAQKKVYKIQLKENDKLIFDENRLIGLFKKNNRLYIIARKKIIYFELQNESV